jgi:ABC-2 type transport system permease protein
MNLLRAFIFRDLAIERTYRFNLVVKMVSVAIQLLVFYFLSVYLARPGYFPFVLVGLMFSKFFQFCVSVFSEAVRQEQYWGTMESLLSYPGTAIKMVFASALAKSMFLILELLFFLAMGFFVFKINMFANSILFVPYFISNGVMFFGFGLISAAFVLYFKKGDPVNWLFTSVFDLLSGVYFAVDILPKPLQYISRFLPTTPSLNTWRDILLKGSFPVAAHFLLQLSCSMLVFLAGTLIFNYALSEVKARGDAGTY